VHKSRVVATPAGGPRSGSVLAPGSVEVDVMGENPARVLGGATNSFQRSPVDVPGWWRLYRLVQITPETVAPAGLSSE